MAGARRGPAKGASAAAVLREVVRGAADGWTPGLTVLFGDDAWHLDRAVQSLVDALVPEGSGDFGLTVFGDDRVDVATVVEAARSRGMFSTRRVVLVRDASVLEGEPAAIEQYALHPPPDSYLLVRAPALDQRRKLGKVLAGAGRAYRFDREAPGRSRDLPATVRALAEERGLRLPPEGIEFLVHASAGDLYAVVSELDKLRAWVGPGDGRVRVEDVRALAASAGPMSGWEVADALLERDAGAAASAARRLLSAGEEPLRLLGGLAWRIRPMIQARALLDRGVPAREVAARLRLGWTAERVLNGVRRYSMEELIAFPYHVAEADRTLKSSGIDPGAVFERLVLRLVGADRGRAATA